jgi:hypothetical protein
VSRLNTYTKSLCLFRRLPVYWGHLKPNDYIWECLALFINRAGMSGNGTIRIRREKIRIGFVQKWARMNYPKIRQRLYTYTIRQSEFFLREPSHRHPLLKDIFWALFPSLRGAPLHCFVPLEWEGVEN